MWIGPITILQSVQPSVRTRDPKAQFAMAEMFFALSAQSRI